MVHGASWKGITRYSSYFEDQEFFASGFSPVNALVTQLRDPMNMGASKSSVAGKRLFIVR